MTDQAPRSSALVRRHMLGRVFDPLAELVADAEISTRVTGHERAHTTVRLRCSGVPDLYDQEAVAALRTLPGADSSISVGSPGRTYTVYWDGVRALV
jgi:hypothetical protein